MRYKGIVLGPKTMNQKRIVETLLRAMSVSNCHLALYFLQLCNISENTYMN